LLRRELLTPPTPLEAWWAAQTSQVPAFSLDPPLYSAEYLRSMPGNVPVGVEPSSAVSSVESESTESLGKNVEASLNADTGDLSVLRAIKSHAIPAPSVTPEATTANKLTDVLATLAKAQSFKAIGQSSYPEDLPLTN